MKESIRFVLAPLLVILCCLTPFVIAVWYTHTALDGSIKELGNLILQKGFFSTFYRICQPYFFGTFCAWKILSIFTLICLSLFALVPGKPYYDRKIAADGTLRISKANGLFVFVIILALYFFCSHFLQIFSITIIYDHFPALIGALNLFSIAIWLFSKSKIAQTTALLPSFLNRPNALFTICRTAMIGWGLILISFAAKQHALHGIADSMIVSLLLQFIFIVKFFLWEIGYLRAMDVPYDRSGLCLCWGSMVWIPAIYTSPTLYLVHHPHQLGLPFALALLICGSCCIAINFLVDRQRHYVRNKNGDCLVWRKKPDLIFANYKTEWGEEKQNLLLVSGWWGLSRHFHYIPELLGVFFWSATALFYHFLPYLYFCFLACLLIDRAFRHEKRCAVKYGKDWEKYCEKVPFRIIPFIY